MSAFKVLKAILKQHILLFSWFAIFLESIKYFYFMSPQEFLDYSHVSKLLSNLINPKSTFTV